MNNKSLKDENVKVQKVNDNKEIKYLNLVYWIDK